MSRMKWIVRTSAAFVCMALAISAGFLAGQVHASGAKPVDAPKELHFVIHNSAMKVMKHDPNTDTIGDLLVAEDPLYDTTDQQVVGKINGDFVLTHVGDTPGHSVYEGSGTIILPDGQISFEGPFTQHEAGSYSTITGGTQAYDNVHGQMHITANETQMQEGTKYKIDLSYSQA